MLSDKVCKLDDSSIDIYAVYFSAKLRSFYTPISMSTKEVLTSLAEEKGIKTVEARPARSPVSRIEIQMRVAIHQLTI